MTLTTRGKYSALVLLLCGLQQSCITQPEPTEPIEYTSDWFRCESRFDCVAVYDAFCQLTAVNTDYMLIYQDWARQQVERVGELAPCPTDGKDLPVSAACRRQRCEYP